MAEAEAEGTGWQRQKGPDGRGRNLMAPEGTGWQNIESKIEGEREQCGRIEQGNVAGELKGTGGKSGRIERHGRRREQGN